MFQRRSRKSYYKKEYRNPFFGKKAKIVWLGSDARPTRKILGLAASALIIAMLWFLFYSEYFKIKSIDIFGLKMMPEEPIRELTWAETGRKKLLFFPQTNIFLFDKNELKKTLSDRYNFNKLVIRKNLPSNINIELEEKPFSLIWLEESRCHYMSEAGELIAELPCETAGGESMPILENRGKNKSLDKKIAYEEKYISFILKLKNDFNSARMQLGRFILDDELNTVKVSVKEGGVLLFFNTELDLAKQIGKLNAVTENTLKDNFASKEYIDLRYGDNVYYK